MLRAQEAEVRVRLDAKQSELDGALAELDVGKKHLAVVSARLEPGAGGAARAARRDV